MREYSGGERADPSLVVGFLLSISGELTRTTVRNKWTGCIPAIGE
jgi:hypothetical protein